MIVLRVVSLHKTFILLLADAEQVPLWSGFCILGMILSERL
jgi:hypothetical protein